MLFSKIISYLFKMTVYYILIHAILPLMQWHSRFNCKFIPRLPVDKSIGAKKLGDLTTILFLSIFGSDLLFRPHNINF